MEKLNKFTHGLVIIDPSQNEENGDRTIIHFVGYWSKPNNDDVTNLKKELISDFDMDEKFIVEEASEGVVNHYNNLIFDPPTKETIQEKWEYLDEGKMKLYEYLLPTISIKLLPKEINWEVGYYAKDDEGIVHKITE